MRPDLGARGPRRSRERQWDVRRRLPRLLVAVAVVAGLAACGEDKGVGDKSLLDIEVQKEGERLGETTTTTTTAPVASPTTTASGRVGVGAPTTTTTTTRPTTTTTTAPAFEILITGDRSGMNQFEPANARVGLGTVVRWTNKDSVVRSVAADNSEFVSPSIPPGQSWNYRTTKAGRFNYHDGTRPYAVAVLEVVAR